MSAQDVFVLWPEFPLANVVVWIAAALLLLYLARNPMHRLFYSGGHSLRTACRMLAAAAGASAHRMAERNRERLLAAGRDAGERAMSEEFRRIEKAVRRDLEPYPELHRRLLQLIDDMERDYRKGAEIATPELAGWVRAIEAVASLQSSSEPAVAGVLEDIRRSLERSQEKAMREYRRAAGLRHAFLGRTMPMWRKLTGMLERFEGRLDDIRERAAGIDRQMERYQAMTQSSVRAVDRLRATYLNRFLVSLVLTGVVVAGVAVNLSLVTSAMGAVIDPQARMGALGVDRVAAVLVVALQLGMSLLLLESLRFTRLLDSIGALEQNVRLKTAGFSVLVLLGLAVMAAAMTVVQGEPVMSGMAEANGEGAADNGEGPVTSLMILAFVLPLALALAPIALEALLTAGRLVLGHVAEAVARGLQTLLRLLGHLLLGVARLLVTLYDLVIFLPLWLEQRVVQARAQAAPRADAKPAKASGQRAASGAKKPE